MGLTDLLPEKEGDLLNVFETRRDRLIVTLFLIWAASFVIVMTGVFQPPPQAYVTGAVCGQGGTCDAGTECFATAEGGRCVDPGYVAASCDWHETAAVAESHPQQVVCSPNLGVAAAKIVFAPVYALLQIAL